MIVGAGDVLVADPVAALADLASHRATLTTSFDGTVSGAAQKWTRVTTLALTKDPHAGVLTVVTTGAIGAADPAWIAEQNGVVYTLDAAGACSAQLADPETSVLEEPAVQLPGVWGGTAAGTETVNGIETSVAAIDAASIGYGGDTTATGKVWVATASGLVVRYDVTMTAGPDVFGENTSGTSETHYSLTDVNAPVTPDIPSSCATGLVDAPLPPGATVVMSEPGVLTATTTSSVAEVAAFYAGAASGAGWTSAEPPGIAPTAAILKFTSPTTRVEVIVTSRAGVTGITILTART